MWFSHILKALQLILTLISYLKIQPALFYIKAIVFTTVLLKILLTYLLFCTSVSNKCLEMKVYSTPSLSWLLLGRVVSAVWVNEGKIKERCTKQYNANQFRKHWKVHNCCAILSVAVPSLLMGLKLLWIWQAAHKYMTGFSFKSMQKKAGKILLDKYLIIIFTN